MKVLKQANEGVKSSKVKNRIIFLAILTVSLVELINLFLCIKLQSVKFIIPIVYSVIPEFITFIINLIFIRQAFKYHKNRTRQIQRLFSSISIHRRPTEDDLSYRICKRNRNSKLKLVTCSINYKPINLKKATFLFVISVCEFLATIFYYLLVSLFSFNFHSICNNKCLNFEIIVQTQALSTIIFNFKHILFIF